MKVKEAHGILARDTFKRGDDVRLVRGFTTDQLRALVDGWACGQGSYEDANKRRQLETGNVMIVASVHKNGAVTAGGNYYPWYCLELVEKGKPEIKVGGEPVQFYNEHIEVWGQKVSKETVDKIHDRLNA